MEKTEEGDSIGMLVRGRIVGDKRRMTRLREKTPKSVKVKGKSIRRP